MAKLKLLLVTPLNLRERDKCFDGQKDGKVKFEWSRIFTNALSVCQTFRFIQPYFCIEKQIKFTRGITPCFCSLSVQLLFLWLMGLLGADGPLTMYILNTLARGVYKLCQIGHMGHIFDFLRSDSVHFGSWRQSLLKLVLKSPRFVPFVANPTQFGCQI